MPWFITFALLSAWFSYNLYRPIQSQKHGAAVSFLSGLMVGELALHHLILQIIIALLFVYSGVVTGLWGALSLLLLLGSWGAMGYYYLTSDTAKDHIEKGLKQGLGEHYLTQISPELKETLTDQLDWQRVLFPHRAFRSPVVTTIRNIIYHEVNGVRLKLDIRHRHDQPQNCPVLFQIHGGAWTFRMGSKNEQALPLMNYLAEQGWVCVSIDYRLSPLATFPDHIIDCKRALQWVKQHIHEYGGDPEFIIATGGSAGGHLSALLALTPNLPEFQPGFEDFDSSVQGCVSFYGIYDFLDHHKLQAHTGLHDLLQDSILKASKSDKPELYRLASPITHIGPHAPPFLLLQGDKDTLVSPRETRMFADELRQVSKQPVALIELPGAQHAFDLFPSLRSELVLHGVVRYLNWVYSQRPR
ncbi:alpha/beta hydrolase [Hahella ganghwensis]|uniref:alpha/beta hydrolase n=1 Tax=Hahella ganghwensis TaxID=286420 RepID=UPI00037E1724|nr:alpha/beta hydrolase [Hahella ganghwensis]